MTRLRQAALVLWLCGGASVAAAVGPASAAEPVRAVKIENFAFVPGAVVVKAGTIVTWTNSDDDAHSVVADDTSFRSKPLDTGDTFSFTFTKAGEYSYHCGLHPHMIGRVTVRL